MNKEKVLQMIEELKNLIMEDEQGLQLEDHNFRVDSNGWKKITVDTGSYLVNPEGDIWEFVSGEYQGEQLFTWYSAIRETKKAGKKMPTDEEFSEFLKTKADMPNLVPAGYYYTNGTFNNRGYYANFWSSSEHNSTYAWNRFLYYNNATIYRSYYDKDYGFSVRCTKN